jgi:predicted dehydrogenase
MSNHYSVNRRSFLRSAALAASAPFILPSHVWSAEVSPNNRITMGCIGMGTQGRGLLGGWLGMAEVQVVAVNDCDGFRLQYHKKMVEDRYAKNAGQGTYKGCEGYKDFRELLQRKDIDAVCIATPDHWHAIQVIMAANAKKDIYCEKPLSLTIAEARAMVNAVRKNQRVFQTGSMQRSSREFLKACELVRNGVIGKIQEIYVSVGGPSKWCDLPEEPMEPDLDWDMWLGPAPMRPYNSVLSPRRVVKEENGVKKESPHSHFPNWRNYREYSGGMMTDWGAHHFDIAQWGLGMDESGPVEIIPPENEKATAGVRFLYDNGVEMVHGPGGGVQFIGTEGEITVNRGKLSSKPDSILKEPLTDKDVRLYKSPGHQRDWLNCIKTRKQPICHVEIGARSVTVCHLGNLAYWHHKKLKWDPKKWEFVGDDEANKWLDRERRAPWTLPKI